MRKLFKWRRELYPPVPVNVRLVNLETGHTVPVELVYTGFIDGLHHWMAVARSVIDSPFGLWADEIPPHTTIELQFSVRRPHD